MRRERLKRSSGVSADGGRDALVFPLQKTEGPASLAPRIRSNALGLDGANVRRLRPFRALGDLELDGLPLAERTVALTRDTGEVHEYVFAALLGDEAVALLVAEPLNGSAQSLFPPSVATLWRRC